MKLFIKDLAVQGIYNEAHGLMQRYEIKSNIYKYGKGFFALPNDQYNDLIEHTYKEEEDKFLLS